MANSKKVVISNLVIVTFLGISSGFHNGHILGVTREKTRRFINDEPNWIRSYEEIDRELYIPTVDELLNVKLPYYKLKSRVFDSSSNESIEPLFLSFKPTLKNMVKIARKYAKKDHYSQLLKLLVQTAERLKSNPDTRIKFKVDSKVYKLIDKESLAKKFQFPHHQLKVDLEILRKNNRDKKMLVRQIQPFFSKQQWHRLRRKINKYKVLHVDRELLPPFPRKVVKKFVVYRGPNCFHASLAFHNRTLTKSGYFNVTREKGYHRAMINYDELWRTLNSNFYPVNHTTSPIKYGDILVFFDIPRDLKVGNPFVYFRWIKHTAIYLFNEYTFSKGSKSADTPYTIKTLKEEWRTWSRLTKNLGVKIFRRGIKNVKRRPPKDLTDWIY